MERAKTASAAEGGAHAPPGSGAAPIPRFSWRYLADPTTVFGTLLSVLAGIQLFYFFNALSATLFVIAAIALLIPLRVCSIRVDRGDLSVEKATIAFRAALVAVWMASAIALWTTGNPTAGSLAISITAVWTAQLISFSRNGTKAALAVFLLCGVPMLGFLVYASWTEYPTWLAIVSSFFAIFIVVSIASSVRLSAQVFVDLRKALSEISGTKARLEFAIQSAGDGYFEFDLNTREYTPDSSMQKLLGFEPGTKDLPSLRERTHPDDVDALFANMRAAREGKLLGWKQDLRVRLASGEFGWMHLRSRVLEDRRRNSRVLIGTLVDLSDRKALEEELRAAKEAAEASSQAKSQFLANMSHEIRTPLNGVLGMTQALESRSLDAESRDMVVTIRDSGTALMAILNDVLDLSKIEAGKLEISAVPGDFLHTMKRTRQLFQAQAEDKGLELLVRHDANFPQRLAYDPVRVRQCLSNLLSNAIKFTAQGRVEVAISSKRVDADAHLVRVDVVDTGMGMSAETLAKLFTVFTQADGATTRKFGGSGLGLAISRQLARLMGGDLTVQSTEGKGSTFRLTFKAQEAAPASQTAPQAAARASEPVRHTLRGTRVLLTDDNAINRQVIKLFLAPQGCDITEAINGKEVLDKIATTEFDLVLLDVHMPVMDGKEAIQRIRANPKWKHLPVIALTADAMSGDREKYLALGMTDYVSKPVDQRELVAKMYAVLKLEAPNGAQQDKTKTGT